MSKNIVLCFDGTWNTPGGSADPKEDDSTNVCRFHELVAPKSKDGRDQVKWYNSGVGTERLNRVRGGALGKGLDSHIMTGYKKLLEEYSEGDQVFLVGFSRGAYTARSLVGLIRNAGLLRTASKSLIDRAFAMYRSRDHVDSEYAQAFRRANSIDIAIQFVGVWDTVGALGIPIKAFREFDAKDHEFHDTRLSSIVKNAFQAIAVDEHREPYAATLWGEQDPKDLAMGQILEQVWFTGAHADVGGGYPGQHPIADMTLEWMQHKAEASGLAVEALGCSTSFDIANTSFHDSFRDFLGGLFSLFAERHYRPIGQLKDGPQRVHGSVFDRIKGCPSYRPKNRGLFDASVVRDGV